MEHPEPPIVVAIPSPIAFTEFADRPVRPVYREAGRQFVIDNRGKRVYGVWWVLFDLFEEPADVPVIIGEQSDPDF